NQEAKISIYLGKFGLPLPLIHCLCINDNEIDFLISQFIDSDNSPPDGYLLGQLMKEIHNKPVPQLKPVLQGDEPLNRTLSERIVRRLRVVANLAAIDIEIPTLEAIQALLDRYEVKRYSLLHMDARPENLLTQKGSIVGIVDWANALIADRGLELARIAEYGYLTPEFLSGYGQENCFSHLPKEVELIYRLDTAVMLGVVFLSEAPDPENAKVQLKRIIELGDELKKYFIYH
ncbi:MAG: aminoglycoside phosphotransferase family protein, partial [Candidatus Aminicenantes bacterium]